jgi:hypothetical protein
MTTQQARHHGRDGLPPRKGLRQARPMVQFRVPRYGPRRVTRGIHRVKRIRAPPAFTPGAPRVRIPFPPP